MVESEFPQRILQLFDVDIGLLEGVPPDHLEQLVFPVCEDSLNLGYLLLPISDGTFWKVLDEASHFLSQNFHAVRCCWAVIASKQEFPGLLVVQEPRAMRKVSKNICFRQLFLEVQKLLEAIAE